MSDASDTRRTLILERAIKGAPISVVIQRLMVLLLAMCDMLDQRGVDSTALLEGMTFDEQVEQPKKNERYGEA